MLFHELLLHFPGRFVIALRLNEIECFLRSGPSSESRPVIAALPRDDPGNGGTVRVRGVRVHIAIDMIGAQSPSSRGRGIGRYSESFVKGLVAAGPAHTYTLLFYRSMEHHPEEWAGVDAHHRFVSDHNPESLIQAVAEAADGEAGPVDLLLHTSPMEAVGGWRLPIKPIGKMRVASLIYDFIPVLEQEKYLHERHLSHSNYQALHRLRQLDLLLCISDATRQDCLRVLGIPPERVVSIGSASDDSFFTPSPDLKPSDEERTQLLRLGITKPFVLSVSGMDDRKNYHGVIEGFSLLPWGIRDSFQVVLTCSVNDDHKRLLLAFARKCGVERHLVITNSVSDEVLRTLYRNCTVFLFPSRYEGFGLPLLEAMLCAAPVIGGNNSSQIEIVSDVGLLVNAHDVGDIADKLQSVLTDEELAAQMRERSLAAARNYSWPLTAQRAHRAIDRIAPTWIHAARHVKPRIAFFSPLPPKQSGISDYSVSLLEQLTDYYSIDIFHDVHYIPALQLANPRVRCFDHRLFRRRNRALSYHATFYQMGNSAYHGYLYPYLCEFPGVVTLHDMVLTGFHAWLSFVSTQAGNGLGDEAFYELRGDPYLLRMISRAGTDFNGTVAELLQEKVWMNRRLLENSLGVVVHDPYVRDHLIEAEPAAADKLTVIPLGSRACPFTPVERARVRIRLNLPVNALLFGCFGMVHGSKCVVEVIEAFAPVAEVNPLALLLLVGKESDYGESRARVRELGLTERVRYFGHCSLQDFEDLIGAVDVGVNLRKPPTNGETSASLMRMLGCGVPPIVSDVGTFGSLSSELAIKVPPGVELAAGVSRAMLRLARDGELRQRMGQAGLAYTRETLDWVKVARRYADFIEECVRRRRANTFDKVDFESKQVPLAGRMAG
jgi:glycosyltransferase involved in cell wall biosynthesis